MIIVHNSGSVTLEGRTAKALLLAIAGIRDEVKDVDVEYTGNIDDWECALGDFIANDLKAKRFVNRYESGKVSFTWRKMKFRYGWKK